MKKAITNTDSVNIAELPTWRSGVIQSHAFRITKKLSDNFLKQYNLSTMHWFIIGGILECPDGIRITDLAAKLGTTTGYLTNAVNALEAKNMVLREEHETDSRTKPLRIHPDFVKTCYEIEDGLREEFRRVLYKHMSREELSAYINVLTKLTRL